MQNTGLQHLSRLSDAHLLEATASLVRQRDGQTAVIVTHLSVVAARQAFRPLGYSSLYRYCVHELRMSEQLAYKHVWAVRLARRCPVVLAFIADGRVHLSGVCELARHVTSENASELLEAVAHRTRREIQRMIAERFPKPDLPTRVTAVRGGAAPAPDSEPPLLDTAEVTPMSCKPSPGKVSPGDVGSDTELTQPSVRLAARTPERVEPISATKYAVQVTVRQRAHDLLRRAQELLAHSRPGCDVADVLELALEQLVHKLESRKFGDTDKPRARRVSCDSRRVPAEVRRQVAKRDARQCTFESHAGVRCTERSLLEYDHVTPVARGGRSTVDNLRLRCRAHDQLAAEQVFGEGFMRAKRAQAARPPAYTKARATGVARAPYVRTSDLAESLRPACAAATCRDRECR